MVEIKSMFINGEWVKAQRGKYFDVRNPATGEVIAKVPEATESDVSAAIDAAKESFNDGVWSRLSPGDRSNLLLKDAEMLDSRKDEFIRI